jgi:hypothetical protein
MNDTKDTQLGRVLVEDFVVSVHLYTAVSRRTEVLSASPRMTMTIMVEEDIVVSTVRSKIS